MGHYLLSVWHDDEYEVDFDSKDTQRQIAQVTEFNQKLIDSEALVYANGMHPASTAYVVRTWNDEVTEIDGPFVETKEQMGGFWVIDAPDAAMARDWAKKATVACEQPVEVREMHG